MWGRYSSNSSAELAIQRVELELVHPDDELECLIESLLPVPDPEDAALQSQLLELLGQLLLVHTNPGGDALDLLGLLTQLHGQLGLLRGEQLLQQLDLDPARRRGIAARQRVHELSQPRVDVLAHRLSSFARLRPRFSPIRPESARQVTRVDRLVATVVGDVHAPPARDAS